MKEINEKFSWVSPEFNVQHDTGHKKVRIKGVAMKGNAVSKNNRRYVDEELKRAARTFIGCPITINHDDGKKVGEVTWMEYDEDGVMEYIGDVWKQPYVDLIKSKSTEIKGVSIQASYLHNVCPDCGVKFYSEQDFSAHRLSEGKPVNAVEPHGIRGTALSLVLSPEVPGFPGTTIELAETRQMVKGIEELFEMVINEQKEKENMSNDKPKSEEKKDVSYPYKTELKPEPQIEVKPLPEVATTSPPAPIVETKQPKQIILKEEVKIGKLVFKEEECTPFEECVKNGGTPEECARKFKETKQRNESDKFLVATVNEIIDVVSKPIILDLPEVKLPEYKPYDDAPIKVAMETMGKTLQEKVDQIEQKLPQPYNDQQLKEELAKLAEALKEIPILKETVAKQKQDFDSLLNAADKSVKEYFALEKKEHEADKSKISELEGKIKEYAENAEKKVQETQNLNVRVENLEDKLQPQFKGKEKGVPAQGQVNAYKPYGN